MQFGWPGAVAKLVRHCCQAGTQHLLSRNAVLKCGQGMAGDSIRCDGDLERQRLQLLQVDGGEFIPLLDCLETQLEILLARLRSLVQ